MAELKQSPDLSSFDTVWERVTDSSDPTAQTTIPTPTTAAKTTVVTGGVPVTTIPRTTVTSFSDDPVSVTRQSGSSVSSDSAITSESNAAALRSIIDTEAKVYRTCCELARKCSGTAGAKLRAMSESSKRTIRQLQEQYFIQTGQYYSPSGTYTPPGSLGEALRQIILNENTVQLQLQSLAESTNSPSLARACLCAERDTAMRCCTAERLLSQCA